MSGLTQLLIDLGTDAQLQQQYEADPEGVMKNYNLNQEEIQAMLDKDLDKLRQLSGLENLQSNGHIQAHDYD